MSLCWSGWYGCKYGFHWGIIILGKVSWVPKIDDAPTEMCLIINDLSWWSFNIRAQIWTTYTCLQERFVLSRNFLPLYSLPLLYNRATSAKYNVQYGRVSFCVRPPILMISHRTVYALDCWNSLNGTVQQDNRLLGRAGKSYITGGHPGGGGGPWGQDPLPPFGGPQNLKKREKRRTQPQECGMLQ